MAGLSGKRPLRAALALVLLTSLSCGCGALPITLTGALPVVVSGAGGGVAYTVTNVAYKTVSYPLDDVEKALNEALGKMKIKKEKREPAEDGVRITASTKKLTIYIDLERITPVTTRIKVNAKRGPVLKDKATATEIIEQTDKALKEPGKKNG